MPIDTSIYSQLKPVQIENPLAQYAQLAQVQNAQNQNRLADLAFTEKQREANENRLLGDAYKSALKPDGTIDRNALYSGLAQGGLGTKIQGVQKGFADQDKSQREAEKAQIEGHLKKFEVAGQIMAPVKDQASWAIAKQQTAQVFGPEAAAQMPDVYDPALVEQKRAQAMAVKDQLEQVWKQKGYDLDVSKFGYQQQNDAQNRGVTLRGQDMSQATALRGQNLTDARAREANALKKQELSNEASTNAVLGVPQPAVFPWANQSNSKDANKVKLAEGNRGSKEVEKDIDAARQAALIAQDATRFLELNSKVNTGGVSDKIGLTRWAQGLGPDYAEMEAITARLAPANRPPGSGATSDYDAKQFERATVGVDKPQATNKNIANAIITKSQMVQDYADFRTTYLEQNGTLQGADRYWKQYADKNPIFDPKKPGSFELNKTRKDWRQHFASGGQQQKAGASQAPAPSQGIKFLGFE